jgi:hypothetical protein
MDGPTTRQLDLFRAVEDVHELTEAIVVLLVDAEGASVAVSGDEDDLPPPLRAVLAGKRLKAAGSVVALLSPIAPELADSRLNVSIYDVDGSHLLAVAFGADADFDRVRMISEQGREMIAEILRAS